MTIVQSEAFRLAWNAAMAVFSWLLAFVVFMALLSGVSGERVGEFEWAAMAATLTPFGLAAWGLHEVVARKLRIDEGARHARLKWAGLAVVGFTGLEVVITSALLFWPRVGEDALGGALAGLVYGVTTIIRPGRRGARPAAGRWAAPLG